MDETNVPNLTAIVAVAENRVIGINNSLPWHMPNDLKRFKALTYGKPVLMGKNTFLSLPSSVRPLPNRENNVLSYNYQKDPNLKNYLDLIHVHRDLDSALVSISKRHNDSEVMVIGGESVYSATINIIRSLHLTTVHLNPKGNAYFPIIDRTEWSIVNKEEGIDNGIRYTYENLIRVL